MPDWACFWFVRRVVVVIVVVAVIVVVVIVVGWVGWLFVVRSFLVVVPRPHEAAGRWCARTGTIQIFMRYL